MGGVGVTPEGGPCSRTGREAAAESHVGCRKWRLADSGSGLVRVLVARSSSACLGRGRMRSTDGDGQDEAESTIDVLEFGIRAKASWRSFG